VQRSADVPLAALTVELVGDLKCIRVQRPHRVQGRTVSVDRLYPVEVSLHNLPGGKTSVGIALLKFINGDLLQAECSI
jgi:hypothetical protein